jgi:His/Glu/Gln/Arg/opine family amino acid ABC transporter permease subunit
VLRFENPWRLGKLATAYVELIRAVPLVGFLVFVHYGLLAPWLGPRADYFFTAWVAFSLFEAAYFSEILRTGLRALRREEREAAISLGLTPLQRYRLVYGPLALRRASPALVNQAVTLIKDTAIASILGLVEFTRAGEIIYERTYQDLPILMLQALVYFLLCYSLSRLGRQLERRPQ